MRRQRAGGRGARRSRRRRSAREWYVALRREWPITEIRKKISILKNHIESLTEAAEVRLPRYRQDLVEARRELVRRVAERHRNDQQYDREFRRLREHPDIARIRVRGARTTVTLRPLFIRGGSKTYDLGILEFTIDPDGLDCMNVRNLTRRIDGAPHPRVDDCGLVHWCDIGDEIEDLVGARDFAGAINLFIAFLKSPEHGPECREQGWPLAWRKRARRKKRK